MTRRIALAQLALLVVILAGAVLPLGLATAADDQHAYTTAATSTARSLATIAEENLDDNRADPQLPASLARAVRDGDGAQVIARDGAVLAEAGQPVAAGHLLRQALAGHPATQWHGEGAGRLLAVAVPVGDQHPPVGAVLLVRPAQPLDQTVRRLWLRLAGLAVAAALATAAVAVALSRWVGQPVRRLESAARAFGPADLQTRADAAGGPAEVRRLAAAFNAMAGRLQTLVHGHQAVIADVSHQLRTPLAAIRLRLELLAEEVAGSHAAGEVTGALAELARLSRLVDGMLAIARAENTVLQAEPVRADLIAGERVEAWRPVADEAQVTMEVHATGQLTAVLPPGHLEQILDNLLDNAITATPPEGTVTVHATGDTETTRILIIDDGPGMTEQQKANAFHRFSTTGDTGTGLGLAIVQRLITASGGQATLDTAATGGLAVSLQLPARSTDSRAPAHAAPRGSPTSH